MADTRIMVCKWPRTTSRISPRISDATSRNILLQWLAPQEGE